MKPIRMENGVIVYYGSFAGRVSNGCAVVDPLFDGPELNGFLGKQKDIQEVKWQDGTFERLMDGSRDTCGIPVLKDCRVWQLKPDVDIHMKFIDYEGLCRDFGPPDPANYHQVYDGAVETNSLEALYTKFNTSRPPGYAGHSLSMSDVLELYDESGSTFHYVDRFGFKLVDFEPSGQSMAQTPAMQL